MKTLVGWAICFVLGMLVDRYRTQIAELVKKLFGKLFKKEGGQ